jgi:hypothetical protein
MKTDREIQQLVINALTGQPYLNSSEISVSVRNGVVELNGIVESECARVAIQNVITNGLGVKCVFDAHSSSAKKKHQKKRPGMLPISNLTKEISKKNSQGL